MIDKPAGFHVHPPETKPEKVPREKIILQNLRDQLGQKVYPVHRLDAGTSGVLAMALDSEAAGLLAKQFQNLQTEKTYWAIVRGYIPAEGKIDLELESDSSDLKLEAITWYRNLKTLELKVAVGKKFPTARYSWAEVKPKTGRFHQIRRHMNRISHPVVGDAAHGDSHHNAFFREQLGIKGLCLRAMALELDLPWLGERKRFEAGINPKWQKISQLFGVSGGAGSGTQSLS